MKQWKISGFSRWPPAPWSARTPAAKALTALSIKGCKSMSRDEQVGGAALVHPNTGDLIETFPGMASMTASPHLCRDVCSRRWVTPYKHTANACMHL